MIRKDLRARWNSVCVVTVTTVLRLCYNNSIFKNRIEAAFLQIRSIARAELGYCATSFD
jgi:hypothetical protein